MKSNKKDNIKISEEYFPSKNLKRSIYQSPTMKIVTDTEMDTTDPLGFPKDDLPDYV